MTLGTLPLPAAAQTASGTAPPAAPFLGYDHDGRLSATIYMVPIEDLEGGTAFNDLAVGSGTVTSVDIHYNAGHPSVEKPHAHVVLCHDKDAKARLAE